MTTQEILTRVNEAISEYGSHITPSSLVKLAEDLEAQLCREIAASKGVTNATKTITDMLKNCYGRSDLKYPWIDSEGRQCVCNGFQAFRLREHLPLVERPDDIRQPMDLDKIFPASLEGWKSLPMPSVKELRQFIAVERARWTGKRKDFCPIWDFGPHEPDVNALYLLNAATVFPNAATIFWTELTKTLVITCEAGDGLLLPMRTNKVPAPVASDAERKAIESERERQDRLNKENAERAEIVRKGLEESDKAREDARRAVADQAKAREAMEKADTDESRRNAAESFYVACEQEARALLRGYHARASWDETYALLPDEFEAIVRKLNIRKTAA